MLCGESACVSVRVLSCIHKIFKVQFIHDSATIHSRLAQHNSRLLSREHFCPKKRAPTVSKSMCDMRFGCCHFINLSSSLTNTDKSNATGGCSIFQHFFLKFYSFYGEFVHFFHRCKFHANRIPQFTFRKYFNWRRVGFQKNDLVQQRSWEGFFTQ